MNFSSKQRSFYFTKSSRGSDSTSQRAGFGPRVLCLTPLLYVVESPVSVYSCGGEGSGALLYVAVRCTLCKMCFLTFISGKVL